MESYWFFDQLVDILASGEQTGGSYSVSEVLGAQGFATPLHKHRDLDEGCSNVPHGAGSSRGA